MKGLDLLNDINAIRACQGKPPIARIALPGTVPDDPARCPVASLTNALVTVGSSDPWVKRFVLRFGHMAIAEDVAAELGQPNAPDMPEVLAPDAVVSLACALHYGLVFEDAQGFLTGWIEPIDADQGVWDLHLMPGQSHPPGHAPAPSISATAADMRRATERGQASARDAHAHPARCSVDHAQRRRGRKGHGHPRASNRGGTSRA